MAISGTLNGLWSVADPASGAARTIARSITSTTDASSGAAVRTTHAASLHAASEAGSDDASAIAAARHPALLQISQRLGAVLEGGKKDRGARGHIVARLWAKHLLACASGWPTTSVQLGLDGEVVLPPLAQASALEILQTLVDAYRQAWQRPLPVASKTAWAFLRAQARNQAQALAQPDRADKQKDPHEAAQGTFEGGYNKVGERADSAYLARAFESYQEIEDGLPDWATTLYGPLFAHVCAMADPAAGADEEDA